MNVRLLKAVVLGALRTAVTPAGTPDSVRLTLPLKPTGFDTVIVLATLEPPTNAVRLEVEGVRLKLGAGTTKVTTVELPTTPVVPFTVMG